MADSTPAPGDGGDIIIKGGSCEIHFDDGLYKKDPSDPKRRKHSNATLRIKRIVITGNRQFDSQDIADGFKGDITITCE